LFVVAISLALWKVFASAPEDASPSELASRVALPAFLFALGAVGYFISAGSAVALWFRERRKERNS